MARSFNGSGDQINLGNSSTLDPTVPVSISVWFMLTSTPGGAYACLCDRINGGTHYMALLYNSGHMTYYFGSGNNIDPGTASITQNVWYHVGAAIDGSNNATTFMNGVSDGTVAGATVTPAAVNSTLGRNGLNTDFPGILADYAIWNTNLTAAEFLALSRGARPVNVRSANLKAWLPLTGLQSPEPDLSGNANNGTLTGTTPAFGPPIMAFTPRRPFIKTPVSGGGPSFQPAWAIRNRIVVDGIGI